MQNNSNRPLILMFALWMVFLSGYSHAASAATPMVSIGADHALALGSDGTVVSWGSDLSGKLGSGRPLYATIEAKVPGLSGIKAIGSGSGSSHSLAIRQDGTVWSWGSNIYGQLGDGTTINRTSPVQVKGLGNVIMACGGIGHSIAIKQDGTVWTWGWNGYGQLGAGNQNNSSLPQAVAGLSGVTAIECGSMHSLAVRQDGTLWAWGSNSHGELGIGDPSVTNELQPVQVTGLRNVIAIGAGQWISAAVRADGSAWEWGYASTTGMVRASPVQLIGVSGAIGIDASGFSMAALKSDGLTLWRWESGNAPAIQASAGSLLKAVVGSGFTLMLKADRSVVAFGQNFSGQLGDSTTTNRPSAPEPVAGTANIIAIAAGDSHGLALDASGNVWAWGSDAIGQLGRGAVVSRSVPANIDGLANIVQVSAGANHSLALDQSGNVWAWGANDAGQLGDGSRASESTPVQILALTNVQGVAAGNLYSLAYKRDGTVWAWGKDTEGQLGDGNDDQQLSPIQVSGLANVVAIAANDQNLAVKQDGTVWAWGRNRDGELGLGTVTPCCTFPPINGRPVQIPGLSGVKSVAAGAARSFAVKTDGTVMAWGDNTHGNLGDGTLTNRLVPVPITALSSVSRVDAGADHGLARRTDGSVWGWGRDLAGELGLSPNTVRTTPAPIKGVNSIQQVSAGTHLTGMVRQDGLIVMAGANGVGQLGDGKFAQHRAYVLVVNPSADGFLDLNAGSAANPPPELKVPFFISSTGGIEDTSATLITTIKFNAADVGKSGAVFVTGIVPSGSLVAQTAISDNRAFDATTYAEPDTSGFVLVQLTSSGWQLVVNGQLIPYTTGVLGDQLAAQNILNKTDPTNLAGAEFCVGYGTSAAEMSAGGRMVPVATIPSDPNSTSPITVSCIPQNYTDSWWNASGSGWGITITDHGSNAFVQWYTYDQLNHNQKYVISGGTFSSDRCQFSGAITHVTGPSWISPTFDPNLVSRAAAGSGTIDFCPVGLADGTIVFSYTADGVTGSKQLTRLAFGNDVPHWSGTANTGAADFSDLWWNPAESGWGVSVTQHGNNIFFRIFVYDTDGRPLLFIVPGVTFNSATSFTGALTLTSGPWFGIDPFDPFDPTQVVRTTAGTATLTFSDANNGTLTYTVNGVTKTKTITRLAF